MEKERKIKVLSLIALIVSVLGLTVAFAALSQTLTINGTASVNAAEWDIHFENLNKAIKGDAAVNTEPVVDGTSITGFDITITKPNDVVAYMFDIVNAGTVNAKIESVDISPLCTLQSSIEACDWNNDGTVTQEDITNVNNNISVTLADENGRQLAIGDILNSNSSKSAAFSVTYGKYNVNDGVYDSFEESTELPKRNLNFSNINIKINYVQAD